MSHILALCERVVADGRVTPEEVELLKQELSSDGQMTHEDVKLLVNVAASCREVCPEFDAIFYPLVKSVLLDDGQITPDEQYYLMKLLWSDGVVRPAERKLIQELRAEVKNPSPEFLDLCDRALASPATDWDVGGQVR